jgi:acyl-CoA reductase-like NAD-dependent aldehyde dehydrogenase
MAVAEQAPRPVFVAGTWRTADETVPVTAPYSGEVEAEVSRAGEAETREAIDAAERALASDFPPHARARVLDETARAIEAGLDDFARVIALEAGKPLKAAKVEAERGVQTFRFGGVEARRLTGEMVPMDAHPGGEGHLAFTIREPIGIVGAISPFNFPLNLVAHKLSPAIAAGCPVVLKPARATPLTALKLAETLEQAGLPAGFLSVLVGDSGEIGDVLVGDDRVRLISFTGSAAVGWKLKERAPRKRVELELGNNSPAVVAADADLESAAAKLAPNAFGYAGQTCISVQRVLVEAGGYEPFLERFLEKVDALAVGDPLDAGTDVGPVIDEGERDRILSWIDEARDLGAEVVRGGKVRDDGLIEPTVLTGVDPQAKVACQEVFGPVVIVDRCADVDEGLERANDTVYGLQAAIFTRDIGRAFAAARRLRYGGVLINETPSFRVDQMPYGGFNESGNTKEGPRYAVEHMTEQKLVVVNLD